MLSCANNELKRIEAFLKRRKKVSIQGPPGTGKTWLMSRLMAAEQEPGVALTVTNDAAVNLLEEIKSQQLLTVQLILSPTKVKEHKKGVSYSDNQQRTGWSIGTLGYLGERIKKTKTLTSLWIDESSTMESRHLSDYSFDKVRVFGDVNQLGPFSGETSVAKHCTNNPEWGEIRLNLTHRLSLASILPILKFYPDLTASRPIQGIRVGGRYLEGTVLVPFETDTVNEGSSQTTVYEKRWVLKAAEAFKKAKIGTIVTSPYRGFCDQTGGKSVNQIQGLTTSVLILALTNREVNEFCCQPERLLVAVTRATKTTLVVGRIDRLKMVVPWFRHSEVAPPKQLLYDLENSDIRCF